MTDNAVLLEDEYLDAANELRNIIALEKELAVRKEACKEILAKAIAVGEKGVSPDGEILVGVRAGAARFNPEKAARELPAEVLPSVQVFTVDAKRAKAVLAPALYELCLDYNRPSVVAL